MPDWTMTGDGPTATLREQHDALAAENELLRESMNDLARQFSEDKGWRSLASRYSDELDAATRRAIAETCRSMAVTNPLIKRGLQVRAGYIWGLGVEIDARVDGDDDAQDAVTALIDEFAADNEHTLTSIQACEEHERALGTDGEVFLAAVTSRLTGRVQVRAIASTEVVDIIANPEDAADPWFYVREHVETVIEQGYTASTTRVRRQTKKTVYPALGFRPAQRPKTINGWPVQWDQPVLHVAVNRLAGWQRGVGDAFASVGYARAYKDFLGDWAGLTKALSKIAWLQTGDTKGKAQRAATAAHQAAAVAGQTVTAGPGTSLQAVSKSGATIDSESGRPLAAMAAAGLGVSVVTLLADPGTTGARAVAETLDKPTILEMGMRRLVWQAARTRLLNHVITAAVEAPMGRLAGTTLVDDWGRKHTILAGGVEPVLEFTWPPLADLDPVAMIKAICEADDTGKMPPLTTARLLLQALGVKDVDETLRAAGLMDDNGQWVDPVASAGDEATRRFRDGEDPASVL